MLEVRHLVKDYDTGSNIVHALKDISLTFRDSEFVSYFLFCYEMTIVKWKYSLL